MSRTKFLATTLVGTIVSALAMSIYLNQNTPAPQPRVPAELKLNDHAELSEVDRQAARDSYEKYLARLELRYDFTAPEGVTMRSIAGHYYQGDRLGFNIDLRLTPDGRYSATSHGCSGSYATASGTWNVNESTLKLTPNHESDDLVGYLLELNILAGKRDNILIRPEEMRLLRHFGEDQSSCLRRVSGDAESNKQAVD